MWLRCSFAPSVAVLEGAASRSWLEADDRQRPPLEGIGPKRKGMEKEEEEYSVSRLVKAKSSSPKNTGENDKCCKIINPTNAVYNERKQQKQQVVSYSKKMKLCFDALLTLALKVFHTSAAARHVKSKPFFSSVVHVYCNNMLRLRVDEQRQRSSGNPERP